MLCLRFNPLRKIRVFDLLRRIRVWKNFVNATLETLQREVDDLRIANNKQSGELKAHREAFCERLKDDPVWHHLLSPEEQVFIDRDNQILRFFLVGANTEVPGWMRTMPGEMLSLDVISGRVQQVVVQRLDTEGCPGPSVEQPQLLEFLRRYPKSSRFIFDAITSGKTEAGNNPAQPPIGDSIEAEQRFYTETIDMLKNNPDLVAFMASKQASCLPLIAGTKSGVPLPFDKADKLPRRVPAQPKSRSVVFLHNNYYHFNTLAAALRRRGWDAVTVSIESRNSAQRQFYFGEDINLYHDDPAIRHLLVRNFFQTVPERFGALHFYGQYQPSFFLENFDNNKNGTRVPWDFLELRRHRTTIGYAVSGCLDGARQSEIRDISDNVCGRCVWENRPDVCSDAKSQAWARTLDDICGWVAIEGDWAVGDRAGPKFVRGPVTSTLDPDYWAPDLDVPEEVRIERKPNEILVYHAVGNLETRRINNRDIKGSTAIETAVARLQAKGVPIKLFFASKLPITEVRYYKAQADIVVDQLNYGRIGANGRESFMQGLPVITRLMPEQGDGLPELRHIAEAPALNATEQTIEDVLRQLASDPEKRQEMSRQSREYALKWFAADVCARRFEMVIDRVKQGLPADTDELYQ